LPNRLTLTAVTDRPALQPALAEYETAPFPSLTDDQLQAIIDRHGLELDGPIVSLASTGVVHALWSLGSRFVLRVPKTETMCLSDVRTEAVAIPVARAIGVCTPALIAFDDSGDIVDVPYAIVERVHGTDLQSHPDPERHHAHYRELGRQLATLHCGPQPDAHPWFKDNTTYGTTAETIDNAVRAGMLDAAGASWCAALMTRLQSQTESPTPVFVHGDIKPDNLMVDEHGGLVLIDCAMPASAILRSTSLPCEPRALRLLWRAIAKRSAPPTQRSRSASWPR
jgi:aminoglycoside phosphotransferase (APT) family kinase protein